METPRDDGGGGGDGEVIDVLASVNKDKGGEDPPRQTAADDAPPEPRNDDDRRPAREDDDEPQVPRRRGETREEYGRRVQGRINREVALRHKSDRRVDELTIANQDLRDRLVKVERRQSATEVTDDAKKKVAEIDAKIEAVTKKMAAAVEGGDTKAQMDLNIELAGLIADKKIIERRSEYQADQIRSQVDAGGGDPGADDEQDPEKRRIARMSANWQTANRKWWNLRRFSDIRKDAVELDKDLRAEVRNGDVDFEEYSDEYFAELSIRLKDLYPDLDVRGLDGERIEAEPDDVDSRRTQRDDDRGGRDRDRDRGRSTRRPPAGGMGTQDRRRGGSDEFTLAQQGRVRLVDADYAQMREYGLDPQNDAHKKRFAQERMRTILSQGRETRGGGR